MIDSIIKGETIHTRIHTTIFAYKFLTAEDFDVSYPMEEKNFESALMPILYSSPEYKHIKVFDKEGTIIWSDKKEFIGKNFYDSNDDLRKALSGEIVSEFSLFLKEEHAFEKHFGKGLEVYVPIEKNNDIIGVIETYRVPKRLFKDIKMTLITIWTAAILGGLVIYLSLYWLVKSSYTHQLSLEKRIMESKNRLECLIDGLKDGIALLDTECNVLTINKMLAEKFNIPLEDAIGRNIINYIFKGVKTEMAKACGETCFMNKESTFDFESYDEKSKKKSFINVTFFPLKSPNTEDDTKEGKAYHAVLVLRDVTKERELTDELIRSEKLATIGTLFPKISHEIKSPLNALELGLATMQEKYPTDSVLDLLMSSKDKLLHISNDLLAFSRVREEQFDDINLNDVLQEAVNFLKNTTGQIKYHKVIEEYQEDLPKIKGIFGRLEQLFINLIMNASQAMEDMPLSKQALTVGTYLDGEIAGVYIKDCGMGIREEIYDKIFDPFFTTKLEDKGTGLGMSIAQEIVKNHDANLRFESESGKGTTFFIEFNTI
jgi:nitrogen-specific signal transduction histidine kinase